MLTATCARHVIREIIKLYPHERSSLNFENPYQLLIATILSAQATDVSVNAITPKLFAKYPDPESLAAADLSDIEDQIRSIGLYRNKAKFLKGTAQKLLDDYDGQVPDNREDLLTLPGVGRKVANVVLSNAFGIPAFAVDTHVSRVCKHHHIAEDNWSPAKIEKRVTDILPEDEWIDAHHAIIRFGREICHPRNPECEKYPQLYTCLDEEEESNGQ